MWCRMAGIPQFTPQHHILATYHKRTLLWSVSSLVCITTNGLQLQRLPLLWITSKCQTELTRWYSIFNVRQIQGWWGQLRGRLHCRGWQPDLTFPAVRCLKTASRWYGFSCCSCTGCLNLPHSWQRHCWQMVRVDSKDCCNMLCISAVFSHTTDWLNA